MRFSAVSIQLIAVSLSATIHLIIFMILSRVNLPRPPEKSLEVIDVSIQEKKLPTKVSTNTHKSGIRETGLPNPPTSRPGFLDSEEIAAGRAEMLVVNPFMKKESLYANYFDRIRDQLRPLWRKAVSEKYAKKRIVGSKVVVVLSILTSRGLIIRTLLLQSSGDPELDALALEIMLGKLFPNPPAALIDQDGLGRIIWYYRLQ